MRIGLTVLPTDLGLSPVDLAGLAEERGFDSLLFGEHSHVPASLATAFPVGGPLPDKYRRTLDPLICMGAAMVATERLRLGTGICLLAQRDPIEMAKAIATLDLLSGGRAMFGVGFGWNREEMANHGITFGDRRAITAEKLEAMICLWTDDVAHFEGEHVRITPSWCFPKPRQVPHPQVLVGGNGEQSRNFAFLGRHTWMPSIRSHEEADELLRGMEPPPSRDGHRLKIAPLLTMPSEGLVDRFRAADFTQLFLLVEPSSGETSPRATKTQVDEYARWL